MSEQAYKEVKEAWYRANSLMTEDEIQEMIKVATDEKSTLSHNELHNLLEHHAGEYFQVGVEMKSQNGGKDSETSDKIYEILLTMADLMEKLQELIKLEAKNPC